MLSLFFKKLNSSSGSQGDSYLSDVGLSMLPFAAVRHKSLSKHFFFMCGQGSGLSELWVGKIVRVDAMIPVLCNHSKGHL